MLRINSGINSSHLPLLPWCLHICGLHLCLYFCFANRFICVAQRTHYSVVIETGRKPKNGGDLCPGIADSLLCTAEAHTTLSSNLFLF